MFSVLLRRFNAIHLRKYCSIAPALTVKETLLSKPINKNITVRGWVQSVRSHKNLYFVDLVDGSCFNRLQVIIDSKTFSKAPNYGSSIKVEGSVVKSSHKGQEIEVLASSWNTYGECQADYPFVFHQKYSPEFIRQYFHLRPRTRKFSSILRIRNKASMAIHSFFQEEGFCFVHTPVITQNDCEGAGEVFSIKVKNKEKVPESCQNVAMAVQSNENSSAVKSATDDEEFFGAPTYLTVSGQLHLEAMACGMTRVYNFGPAFRAEISHSRQHASEFQMIEGELAFVENVNDLLEIVEKCIKKVTKSLLDSCSEDLDFIIGNNKHHENYLDSLVSKPFVRLSYDEAILILENNKKSIKHGEDLASNHKQYLVKHCNNLPVFVNAFPSSIKPFYMKTDEHNKACCFDLFASYGGEVCGGSLREDNEQILKEKFSFEENSSLSWYLDLRKYGSVPHGGFGIGFERLLQSILGISNIRDLIPFPRRRFDCKC